MTYLSLQPTRVNRKSNNLRVFEVNLACHIVECSLRRTIRSGSDGDVLQVGNAANDRRYDDELRFGGGLKKFDHSLEQHKGPNDVDLVVLQHLIHGSDDCAAIEVANPCVGDYNIKLSDIVRGFKLCDGGFGISLGVAIDLEDDELAVLAMWEIKESF